MATNTKLRPFRQYHDVDVCNLFAYSGAIPVTAGTVVQAQGSGWRSDEALNEALGDVGKNYNNLVSERWGTVARCFDATTGAPVLGITLYDVRETDENGVPYKVNPRKAVENNHVLSGQTVPILTKGFVLISGVFNGSVTAGAVAYPSGAGVITTTATNQVNASQVGKFFGAPDSDGYALLHVNVL